MRTGQTAIVLSWILIQFSQMAWAQNEKVEYFEKHVRPVLRRECLVCHREGKSSGSLALDSRAGWTRGGDSGPAIVPGKPEDSLLIRAVRHEDGLQMPAKAPKLADDVIKALETWIKQGAADPRDQPESFTEKNAAPWDEVARERAKWWCWTLGFYRSVQEPNKQSPPGPLDGDGRRSLFLEVRRNFPNEFMLAFDFPRPAASAGRRPLATVPGQSLTLMNDPFIVHQSRLWVKRVQSTEPTTDGRLRMLYRDLLNRDPTADEAAQAGALIDAMKSRGQEAAGWKLLAHAMFNLKEAIYLP